MSRVLITGGGAGLGAVLARRLADSGARVALLDRDGAAAEATSRSIGGEHALWIGGDVTDDRSIAEAIAAMIERWGGIDAVVNNAGTWDHAPLLELTRERWQRVFDVNFFAPIAVSRAAVPHMKSGSAIVNVSSVLGQVSAPTRGPYCVSKAALISLTKMQAIEWAELGIRVNAIAPGYIATEATLNLAAAGSYSLEAIERRTPMGRFGTADEVAEGIMFLLDPKRAAYITGHVLEVNGGWTAYGFI